MKLVLDTNVLVSGLLNPHGPPGRIVALVAGGSLALHYDARMLSEYEAVLRRQRFAFPPVLVDLVLHQIVAQGLRTTGVPLPRTLPDPDDEPFLEVAVSAGCPLVTGNLRHFPQNLREGVEVWTPAQLVQRLRDVRRAGTWPSP